MPHPLPPELPFDAGLVNTLSDADRALGELAGLGRTLPNPQLLIAPFIRREAVLSSRIEGTQTDLTDLYAYEAGQLPLFAGLKMVPPESDVKEVTNYVRAMEYGLERLQTLPVSLRLIRELHGILMEGVRGDRATPGEFRRSQNWIGRPGCTLNEAEFVPPPVPEMHEALDAFEKYLHAGNTYPPLVRLAFIHYQFETIHPFLDGNGRIGRLLVTLLLVTWNLLPLPLLYLSAFFEQHRQAYYDLLRVVSEKGVARMGNLLPPGGGGTSSGCRRQGEKPAGPAKRMAGTPVPGQVLGLAPASGGQLVCYPCSNHPPDPASIGDNLPKRQSQRGKTCKCRDLKADGGILLRKDVPCP